MKQNRINPVLLQQMCNATNGNFLAVDMYNEESVEKTKQGLMAYVNGEYGFDVGIRSIDYLRIITIVLLFLYP